MSDFSYEVDKDYNYILEEKGNMFTAVRKIKWGNSDTFKLDIRKYYDTDNGETMAKGISLSDDGANELVNVLTSTGYGDTKEIIDNIKDREDFVSSLSQSIGKDIPNINIELDMNEIEMYDPREVFDNE